MRVLYSETLNQRATIAVLILELSRRPYIINGKSIAERNISGLI